MLRILLILIGGLASVGSSAQGTFDPKMPIIGKYSGIIEVDGLPQPVQLQIYNTVPGKGRAVEISYSMPRDTRCNLWEYGGPSDRGHIFYSSARTSTQRCKFGQVVVDMLIVRPTESGGLLYQLFADKSSLVESHILQPM